MLTTLYAQNHLDIAYMQKMRTQKNVVRTLLDVAERRGIGKFVPLLKPYYLLVRDPLKRMASLYRNAHALVAHPRYSPSVLDDARFELVRLIVKNHVKGSADERTKILNLDFNDFIHYIPILFKDKRISEYFLCQADHTKHQSLLLKDGIRFARILKMENKQDMRFMQEKLGINHTTIHANRSQNFPINWQPEARQIMRQYYYEDFEQLGYEC